ncbi:uncharacterized protein LOC34621504 [Cyclospora cayetanensis]|uniref:Uncharacterized protein LOC34621504 n=1 Tax=Cyclospora cayetanensis TaxID=88456 RepID=A0A6P6RT99_9EIME|nr:uncharacterized protein LOC34621504 [Cyclospora cayetanensis]
MATDGKISQPLHLPILKRQDPSGSPRLYDPPSSHRLSVASTGVSEGYTPLFRSPETTCRVKPASSPKAQQDFSMLLHSLPSTPSEHGRAPLQDTVRKAHRISQASAYETHNVHLVDPEILHAKKYGKTLPPLKVTYQNMLPEGITKSTAELIFNIPKEAMLKQAGVSVHTHDPMFTKEVTQYQLEYPCPPAAVRRFPGYESFPLLLSHFEKQKLDSNITDEEDVKHLRGHNEAMLENAWRGKPLVKGPVVREAYMHVPSFGRVQVMLTEYQDGTSYPLVTLPKMTPYDILNVLERQRQAKIDAPWLAVPSAEAI